LRNMMLFVTVATVIIAAMLIGISRSRVNAMPVAPPAVTNIDSVSVDTSATVATVSPPSTQPTPAPLSPQTKTAPATATPKPFASVPSNGSVQVLNGCGAEGAANRMADFLRAKGFDVKDIGNASAWNHQSTMIISRSSDMGLANGIEKLLKTGKVVLIRNGDSMYDVTVVAGPDFEERIKGQ
jgi:hypothetical protein